MNKIIALIIFTLASFVLHSQEKSDLILGTYMTENNRSMVEITKKETKYFGKIIWMRESEKLDDKNPNEALRKEKILGQEILKNFIFNGIDVWHLGTIYDPKNGKTYSCKITKDEKENLNVRGFIGVSLIGRTTFWVKVK